MSRRGAARAAALRSSAVGMVAIAIVASVAVAVAGAVDGGGTPALTGNAPLAVDPVPTGDVAVVAASAPVRNRVAFVVENGTDAPVRVVRVTALAERAEGTQATRASTTDVVPVRLAPGERAIGQVRFRRDTIDLAPVLTWEVRTTRAPSGPDPTRLAVDDLELSPPAGAMVAQTLDLSVTNPHSRTVAGPLVVQVLCTNEAGRPAVLARTKVARRALRAGGRVPVTVELRELCPSHVVGARARLAR